MLQRVIVGVAAQPTIYINYNDQSTGHDHPHRAGAGFFSRHLARTTRSASASPPVRRSPTRRTHRHRRRPQAAHRYLRGRHVRPRYPVHRGNEQLRLLDRLLGFDRRLDDRHRGLRLRPARSGDRRPQWPALSVPDSLAPGTTQAEILVGSRADVCADTRLSSLVSFATRAFKSGVVVAAVSQPAIPAGTTDSLAGNLTISETLNGQFKPGQDICVTILPRTSNGARTQDTFIKTATTNDLPVITTNSASGLLTSSVATPGCPPNLFNFYFGGTPFLPNAGSSFTFAVNQQSFGGTLGVITISNIHLITTADAVNGPVLVDVMGDTDGGAVQFESVVSNASIGTAAAVTTAGSALGATKVGPFTVSTKVAKLGKYVTWKFSGGSALVGKTVQIWVATKNSAGTWGAFKLLTARTVDASGNAYFWWKSSSQAWISVRAGYQTTLSVATQARWR